MSPMTIPQQIITIAICVLGTMLTRFLPFLIFSSKKPTPKYIVYLGKALPCAVFGMLVVYCLKNEQGFTCGKRICFCPSRAEPLCICCWCSSYFDKDVRFFLLTYFGCRSTFSLSDILHLS